MRNSMEEEEEECVQKKSVCKRESCLWQEQIGEKRVNVGSYCG
jgi:hypothetical protein